MVRSYLDNRIQILMLFQHDPESPFGQISCSSIDLISSQIIESRQVPTPIHPGRGGP